MKQAELRRILKHNPQIDSDLLAAAHDQAKNLQPSRRGMVNFNLVLPYASDTPSRLSDQTWSDD